MPRIPRWIVAASVILLLAGCSVAAPKPGGVFVAGDVKDVLAGQCTVDKFERFRPTDFLAALGCGTTGSAESAGEMLTLFGRTFIRTSDAAAGFPTVEAKEVFATPFAMGMSIARSPVGRDLPGGGPEVSLQELLARRVGSGATILLAKASRLEATALKKAPMFGQPIQGEKFRDEYFHPTIVLEGRWVLLFAVAVDPARVGDDATGKEVLARGFYVNLADAASGKDLKYHAHAWVLADPLPADAHSLAEIAHVAKVEQVVHVLGQSRLAVERMAVYPLGELTPPPATVKEPKKAAR
ncbi:MAG: hypothetical protein PHU85_08550 [Phycisphaerae bacterium]|nr:hypothetical protein [Phycisphaerae bacterium]